MLAMYNGNYFKAKQTAMVTFKLCYNTNNIVKYKKVLNETSLTIRCAKRAFSNKFFIVLCLIQKHFIITQNTVNYTNAFSPAYFCAC